MNRFSNVSLWVSLFALVACSESPLSPESDLGSTDASIKAETKAPQAVLPSIKRTGCRSYLEINQDETEYYQKHVNLLRSTPLITRFVDCPFKIEDIVYQRYFYIEKGQSINYKTYSRASSTRELKPWDNKEAAQKRAIAAVIETDPSFCGLYANAGQSKIDLYTESELADGTVLKSDIFVFELSAQQIELCETPQTSLPGAFY